MDFYGQKASFSAVFFGSSDFFLYVKHNQEKM